MADASKAEVQAAINAAKPRLDALHMLVNSYNDPAMTALLDGLHVAAFDVLVTKLGYEPPPETKSGGK